MFSEMPSLLEFISYGRRPKYSYLSCIVKLISPNDNYRAQGVAELTAMRNKTDVLLNLHRFRYDLCWKLEMESDVFMFLRFDTRGFCPKHDLPTFDQRFSIECDLCAADFEKACYTLQPYFAETILDDLFD